MEAELKSIHGATAFEDEYVVDGDGIEVNGALDEQVGHRGSVQVGGHASRVTIASGLCHHHSNVSTPFLHKPPRCETSAQPRTTLS